MDISRKDRERKEALDDWERQKTDAARVIEDLKREFIKAFRLVEAVEWLDRQLRKVFK